MFSIIKKKGEDVENILDIKRVVICCENCKSELRFDLDAPIGYRRVHTCPICGSNYGIDPEDDVITRVQELVRSVKDVKGAKFSFLCED